MRALGGLAIGLTSAWVALHHLGGSFHAALDAARATARGVFGWALVSGAVVLAGQTVRWGYLVRRRAPVAWRDLVRANLLAQLANTFFPGRPGELARATAVGRRASWSTAEVLGVGAVDRCAEGMGIALAALLALALAPSLPQLHRSATIFVGGAALLALAVGALAWALSRARRVAWAARLGEGLGALRSWRGLVAVLLSGPHVLLEASALWMAARAGDLHLGWTQALALLLAINVATLVPVPGSVGTVEAAGVLFLGALGAPASHALAFMASYHLIQLLPGLAGGALALTPWPEAARAREDP